MERQLGLERSKKVRDERKRKRRKEKEIIGIKNKEDEGK